MVAYVVQEFELEGEMVNGDGFLAGEVLQAPCDECLREE